MPVFQIRSAAASRARMVVSARRPAQDRPCASTAVSASTATPGRTVRVSLSEQLYTRTVNTLTQWRINHGKDEAAAVQPQAHSSHRPTCINEKKITIFNLLNFSFVVCSSEVPKNCTKLRVS